MSHLRITSLIFVMQNRLCLLLLHRLLIQVENYLMGIFPQTEMQFINIHQVIILLQQKFTEFNGNRIMYMNVNLQKFYVILCNKMETSKFEP